MFIEKYGKEACLDFISEMESVYKSYGEKNAAGSDYIGVNETYNKAFGNMFYCSLSWNLVKGKESKPDRMKKVSVNMDDGIIR